MPFTLPPPILSDDAVPNPIITYRDYKVDATNLTTYTFTGVAIGPASVGRVVAIAGRCDMTSGALLSVSSITIGGVAATVHVVSQHNGSAIEATSFMASAVVDTGTTADVVITWSRTVSRCGIVSWSVEDALYPFPSSVARDATETTSSLFLRTADGDAVAAFTGSIAGGTLTWTGVTEDLAPTTIESTGKMAAASLNGAPSTSLIDVDGEDVEFEFFNVGTAWTSATFTASVAAAWSNVWSPHALQPSLWLDPSDTTTLYALNHERVLTPSNVVSVLYDKSASANAGATSFSMAGSSSARPYYMTSGSPPFPILGYLDFDGVNDNMSSSAISNFMADDEFEVVLSGRFTSVSTNDANAALNNCIFSDGSTYISLGHARSSGLIGAATYDTNRDKVEVGYTVGDDFVLAVRKQGGTLYVSLDGGAETSVAAGDTGLMTGVLRLGYAGATGGYLTGRFYGAVMRKTVFTTGERTDLIEWMAAKAGVTL